MSSSLEEESLTPRSALRALASVEPAPAAIPDRAAPTTAVDPVSLPAVAHPDPLAPPPATRGVAKEAVKRERHSSGDERRQGPSLQEPSLLSQGEEDPHGLFVLRPGAVGLGRTGQHEVSVLKAFGSYCAQYPKNVPKDRTL